MTLPVPIILVYFGLEYSGSGYAIYDDPVQGVYDDVTYLYADAAGDGINVAGDAFSINVRRGRSRELDEFDTGTATVHLHNFDRTYDNLNSSGVYFGDIVPGKRIEISAWGQTIFTGTIEDWDMDWSPDGDASATILAVDALGALARKEFDAWTSTATTSGALISEMLDRNEVGFPAAARDIDTGNSSLYIHNYSWGTNVLNSAQQANSSELGRFYDSRVGLLTHRDRYALLGGAPAVSFADDGTGVEFHGVTTATGAEFLYNRVGVDRDGGTLQTVEDADSQNAYGVRSLSLSELLLDTDAQSAGMAEYLLGIYKDPTTRIASISVKLHALAGAEQSAVAGLEIGDMVEVAWTPRQVGPVVEQTLVVEGIEHFVGVDQHIMEIGTSPVSQVTVGIYDDTAFGIYDDALAVYGF